MNKILLIIIFFTITESCFSKQFIGNIFIERKQVFDSTQKDWFFGANVANSIHQLTKEYIIEDELLFSEDDELLGDKIYETERNLRLTKLFSNVSIEIDSINEHYSDVIISTQDRWSTIPIIIFGTGGNSTNIGTGIEELNFMGTGTHIRFEAYHRNESNIGWQGGFSVIQQRLFRSEIGLDFSISSNKYRTDQVVTIAKPFRTMATEISYGMNFINSYGRDFLYKSSDSYNLMNFHERRVQLFAGRSWLRNDRVFMSTLIEWEDVQRAIPEYRRAFDNSGKILLSFSSVSEEYYSAKKLNTFQIEDVPVGGWGVATLGKIFPIGHKGENFYYVAGQGEKSYKINDLYAFGQITGASAFSMASGYYTYQEAMGKFFYKFSDKILIASRIRQQSVWNWKALRQLILDNDNGLRGYSVNDLTGDNRLIMNTEIRTYPEIDLWTFRVSGVAFWDFGSVWDQNTEIFRAKWHNSIGIGLRFFNMKGYGEDSIFRLDFAFNMSNMRFGGIIFTTDQLFSVFERHQYKLPQLYGIEFDYQ